MKKFDSIGNNVFRTLLEADVPAPAPAAGGAAQQPPAAGLPQDGGPVNAPAPVTTPADKSPEQLQDWQSQLLTLACRAILKVGGDKLDTDLIALFTSDITAQNKDRILDAIKDLAGDEVKTSV